MDNKVNNTKRLSQKTKNQKERPKTKKKPLRKDKPHPQTALTNTSQSLREGCEAVTPDHTVEGMWSGRHHAAGLNVVSRIQRSRIERSIGGSNRLPRSRIERGRTSRPLSVVFSYHTSWKVGGGYMFGVPQTPREGREAERNDSVAVGTVGLREVCMPFRTTESA